MSNTDDSGSAFLEAQRMLIEGVTKCRAMCGRTLPTDEVISLYYRKALIIAVCTSCFEKVDLVTSMTPEGLSFALRGRSSIILSGS